MQLQLQATQLVGFLLVMVRAAAWVSVCPPFGTRLVPVSVKLGLAVALTLAMSPHLSSQAVPMELAPLLTSAAVQVGIGLALGFLGVVLFSAFQAAGSLIDVSGGFATAQLFDPMTNAQASIFGRFYQLLATVLLFATDGHLLLVRGFLQSFDAVPASTVSLDTIGRVFTHDLGTLFVSALEIAAPLLAALFLADVALGLLSKAAPEMNVFLLGMPVKILLTITLAAVALPLLPGAVSAAVDPIVKHGLDIAGVR